MYIVPLLQSEDSIFQTLVYATNASFQILSHLSVVLPFKTTYKQPFFYAPLALRLFPSTPLANTHHVLLYAL